jgi:type I restriction enzyme S subunit
LMACPKQRLANLILDIKDGGTPSRSNPSYFGGDIAWCVVKDIQPEIHASAEYLTESGLANCSAKVWPVGSVIISLGATIGEIGIAKVPVATKQGLAGIVPDPERITSEFLAYALHEQVETIRAMARGTTIKEVRPKRLAEELLIYAPPLEEQQRIVGALNEAFGAIATATANAGKNLANAQELFEAELKAVLEGVDGEPASFGTTTDIKVGFAFKSAGYSNDPNDIPLIRGDNVVQGQLRWDDLKRWPRSDTTQYDAYRLAAGDVVLAMDRTWVKAGLKYAVIGPDDVPSLLLQRVARLRANKITSPDFVALQIASPAFTEYVLGIQTGLGVPHISGKQIADYCFRLPDLQRQDEIVRRVSEIRQASDQLMSLYASRLRSLEQLKQSLLHSAFSGELTEREPLAA